MACLAVLGCSGEGDPAGPRAWDFGWRPGAPMPVERLEAPAAVVGGKLYVFGGFHKDGGLRVHTRGDVYDPARDAWRRVADMPLAVTHVVAAVDGDRIWLAGGYEGDHPGDVVDRTVVYDASIDAWSEGPPLPEPRASGGLARLGRHLHYFGGFAHDRDTTYGDHWRLPLDGSPLAGRRWERRAPMPAPRGHLSVAVLDGRLYAIGGQFNHDHGRRDVALVHAYDPDTDTWREEPPLPTPRSHAEISTFVRDGRIFVFGGRDTSSKRHPVNAEGRRNRAVEDVTVYDPATGGWSEHGELPHPLLGTVAVAIDGRVIVAGGSTWQAQEPRPETWVGTLGR